MLVKGGNEVSGQRSILKKDWEVIEGLLVGKTFIAEL